MHPLGDALADWYERHGRRALPWRTDREPYRVVVSEFMLQQTQVERVVPTFVRFVAAFPSFEALADASRADVVRAWKGLGYNARAVRLHRLARVVRDEHGGRLPADERLLRRLPGIGAYTARAILAFGFDADVVAIDTNVRRIVHRTQFGLEWPPRAAAVELDVAAAALLPPGRGFAFNSALMDLGASLCSARAPRCLLCPLRSVCAAAPIDPVVLRTLAERHAAPRGPQARVPFERSRRFVRGRVTDRLRQLGTDETISLLDLEHELSTLLTAHESGALAAIVGALVSDGVVESFENGLRLRN